MEMISISTLKNKYADGLELTYESLCALDAKIAPGSTATRDKLTGIVSILSGSKVSAFLSVTRGDDANPVRLELRYNGNHCSPKWGLNELSGVVKMAPFIAACAGLAEERAEPSRLEQMEKDMAELKERMKKLEEKTEGT